MSKRPENKETQHSQTVVSCRSEHWETKLDRSRHSLRCTCHVLFVNSRHFVPCHISASGDAKRCAVLCSTRAFVLLERICIVAETEALTVTLHAVKKPIWTESVKLYFASVWFPAKRFHSEVIFGNHGLFAVFSFLSFSESFCSSLLVLLLLSCSGFAFFVLVAFFVFVLFLGP